MKKLLAILLLALVLVACGSEKPVTLKGTYQTEADDQGNYQIAEVTLVDGKISEVSIDEYYAAKDATKKTLGAEYGMVAFSGIGKEWNEQITALENWMVGKTIDEVMALELTETGAAADLSSSCTIGVSNFLKVVKGAVDAAE